MTQAVHIVGPRFSTMVRSVMLCCEEKGVSYSVGLSSQVMEEPAARALHPFTRIPILLHGDFHLVETGPICRYLDGAFPGLKLQAADVLQQAEQDQWTQVLSLYIDELIVRKYLLEFAFPKGEKGAIRQDVVAKNTPGVLEALSVIEEQLGVHEFFCGDTFSTADAVLIPMLDYLTKLPTAEQLFADRPKSAAYILEMQQRDSCQRVLATFSA